MYREFYKFRELPFALTTDPAFFYLSRQHKFALSLLRYGVASRAGFCLLTGEVGSGKTLVVRQLLGALQQEITVGLISNTSRKLGRLMPWVCLAYGLDYRQKDDAELYQLFVDFLVQEYAVGRSVVLIVDEAQNLGVEMLEELRVLSNVNADKHMVLQTFLVGQPELRDFLQAPQLRQFAQRISIDYHLDTLTLDDAYAYVRHRLAVAGGSADLIAAGAVELAHQCAGGVPRLINQLCDTALVYGFADQLDSIESELMTQVIANRSAGRVFPGRHRMLAKSAAARVV
jgi:type II secretory pathway predicted ATPase ExeA